MFKKYLLLFVLIPGFVNAQFQLKIRATNIPDTIAYFRATIFDEKNYVPKDTFDLRKKIVKYKNTNSIVGGMYYLYFPISKQKINLIIEDNDTIFLELNGLNYLNSAKVNTNKNKILLNYQILEQSLIHYDSSYAFELKSGKKFSQIQKAAYFKNKTDSLVIFRNKALKLLNQQEALYVYFKTLNLLDASIPNKRDIITRNSFLKQFDLNTPKLFFTPSMKQVLVEYVAYYPLIADSLIKALDSVMPKIKNTNKAYPFVFDYFSKLFKNREIQNNTEGYAYFIEKYIKNADATFLAPKVKESFLKELSQLKSQKVKDTCININLHDTLDVSQDLHLFAKNYNYTIVIFYDPNCEHCKVEVPKMDSVINLLEKQLLVKIGKYAICNTPSIVKSEWEGFVSQFSLNKDYVHVALGNDYNTRKAYDAFTNPLFYLIDKEGILLAKKISTNTLRKELVQAFQNYK